MVFNEIQFALFIEVIVAGLVGLGIVIFLYIRLRRRYRVIAKKPRLRHNTPPYVNIYNKKKHIRSKNKNE